MEQSRTRRCIRLLISLLPAFLSLSCSSDGNRAEGSADLALINANVPDKPVLIMDEGLHAAWVNSAALQALNITQDTPDPVPGYSFYKHDVNGDATGYLLEGTAGMAMDALNVITEDVIVEGTGIVIDIMNAYGVTSAFDAGVVESDNVAGVKRILDRLERVAS